MGNTSSIESRSTETTFQSLNSLPPPSPSSSNRHKRSNRIHEGKSDNGEPVLLQEEGSTYQLPSSIGGGLNGSSTIDGMEPENGRDTTLNLPVWKKLLNHVSMRETRSTAELVELIFRIDERGSSIATELRAGCVHFLSVSLILGVNPMQLETAGYEKKTVAAATGIWY